MITFVEKLEDRAQKAGSAPKAALKKNPSSYKRRITFHDVAPDSCTPSRAVDPAQQATAANAARLLPSPDRIEHTQPRSRVHIQLGPSRDDIDETSDGDDDDDDNFNDDSSPRPWDDSQAPAHGAALVRVRL